MKLLLENWNAFLNEEPEELEEGAVATGVLAALLSAFGMVDDPNQEVEMYIGGESTQISMQDLQLMDQHVQNFKGIDSPDGTVTVTHEELQNTYADWAKNIQGRGVSPTMDGGIYASGGSLPTIDTAKRVGQVDDAILGTFLKMADEKNQPETQLPNVPRGKAGPIPTSLIIDQLVLKVQHSDPATSGDALETLKKIANGNHAEGKPLAQAALDKLNK